MNNNTLPHHVIQVILLSGIALVIALVIGKFRRRDLSAFQFVAWLAVFVGGAIAVAFPAMTTRVANEVGIVRGVDLILYVSVIALFYAVFRLAVRIERLNRDVTELVRTLALRAQEKEDAA